MNTLNPKRRQGGIIVNYPGVFLYNGKTYWHKKTFLMAAKKHVLLEMDDDNIVVRTPVRNKKNRFNYAIYVLMWEYEVDMRPDPQDEGSIVMNKEGKVLEPITEFYHPFKML